MKEPGFTFHGEYDPCIEVAAWYDEMLEPGESARLPIRALLRLYPQQPISPATILDRMRSSMTTQWEIRCDGEDVMLTRLC
jgi:hypothetical protein